jgi:Flp pilus assembly protein TadG
MANSKFLSTVARFAQDRSGNYMIAFAGVATMLTMAIGMAVNFAQLSAARSNLLNALDSAVVSTARDITTGLIKEKDTKKSVLAFLTANTRQGLASAGSLNLDDVELEKTTKQVLARASVDVPLAFPVFSTASTQRITVNSAAVYSDRVIEVAMMLDITGSMAGQKIKDLKSAAANAVETFLNSNSGVVPRVRVAIVPYADSVNVGDLARGVYGETSFTTGDPPALDPLALVSSVITNNADTCATDRKGTNAFTDVSPLTAMVNRDYRLEYCPDAVMQPLTTDKEKLLDTIENFKADGYTGGGIGVQWTRYMLSPVWAPVLPADSAPGVYKSKKIAKYAILMTDGEFNTAFADVAENGKIHQQDTKARNAAEAHCAAMKKDGIEIFTIGFMLNQSAAKAVLKTCSSPDKSAIKHYYEVSTGAALDQAFKDIAANIERLAIVK